MDKIDKNKITCTLTGIVVRVAPKTFDERAERYGGVDNLLSNYVCAEGRKLLREGRTPQDIRGMYNVSAEVPMPSEDIINKHTRWAHFSGDMMQDTTIMPVPDLIQSEQVLQPVEFTDDVIPDVQ